MNIQDLENNFKELQQYSDNQFGLVNDLKKEIEKLTAENKSLQKMLEGNLPSLEFQQGHIGISNEQLVCETQIHLLKEQAVQRQLNADETRRFATFVEVLEKIRKTGNAEDSKVRKLSDDDLLKLVVNNDSTE